MENEYIERRLNILKRLQDQNDRSQNLNIDLFKNRLFNSLATSMTSKKIVIPVEIEEAYCYNSGTKMFHYFCVSPSGIGMQQQRSDGQPTYGTTRINAYTLSKTKEVFAKEGMFQKIIEHPSLSKEKKILERLNQIKDLCVFDDTFGDALAISVALNSNVKGTPEHRYGNYSLAIDSGNVVTIDMHSSKNYGRTQIVMKLGDACQITPYVSETNLINLLINDDYVIETMERALDLFEIKIQNGEKEIEKLEEQLKEMFPKESLMLLMKGDKK